MYVLMGVIYWKGGVLVNKIIYAGNRVTVLLQTENLQNILEPRETYLGLGPRVASRGGGARAHARTRYAHTR